MSLPGRRSEAIRNHPAAVRYLSLHMTQCGCLGRSASLFAWTRPFSQAARNFFHISGLAEISSNLEFRKCEKPRTRWIISEYFRPRLWGQHEKASKQGFFCTSAKNQIALQKDRGYVNIRASWCEQQSMSQINGVRVTTIKNL